MQSLRQLGGGVIIALVSVILVIGGISLALAETLPSQATPTTMPPTISLDFPTATFTISAIVSETATAPQTPTPFLTNTLFVPTISTAIPITCTPPSGWLRIITSTSDTIYSLAQRYKITADNLSAANCLTSPDLPVGFALYVPPVPTVTVVPCGPPAGYVKRHVVQAGDNLYRIALSYGITYPQLQRANCMGSSTTIYAGQLLWVPNVPTRTPVPGVTTLPNFPTVTPSATLVPTATSIPPTASSTSIPTATPTFTPSNTPITPAVE
jgi:LysM repeat protein